MAMAFAEGLVVAGVGLYTVLLAGIVFGLDRSMVGGLLEIADVCMGASVSASHWRTSNGFWVAKEVFAGEFAGLVALEGDFFSIV